MEEVKYAAGPGTGTWEPARSGVEWQLPIGGPRLCGWRARWWVLRVPQPAALCQPHAGPGARNTQRLRCVCALPWRHGQLRSGKAGRGAKRRKVGREGPPRNAASSRTPGTRSSCAFAALLLTLCFPGCAWERREPRFARRRLAAGRQEGWRRREPLPAPHTHSQTAVSPVRAHPRPETPVPKCQGNRSSPEAPAGDPKPRAEESAVGRRGWTCRPCRGGGGGGVGGSRSPCQAAPTRPGHLPRSTSAPRRRRARGAAQAAGAEERPDRERDKPFAKPRVHSRALGRRDEDGSRRRRRRRSALPAPSRRGSLSLPARPSPPCGRRSVWRAALAAEDAAAAPAPCRSRRERAETPESPRLPTSSGRSAPAGVKGGGGGQLPTKNNRLGALGVSLSAHNGTGRGTGLAAPQVPARQGGRAHVPDPGEQVLPQRGGRSGG